MLKSITIVFIYSLLAVQIFNCVEYVEGNHQTGVNFTNTTHHHSIHAVPNTNIPSTIIERGETFSNGCFKQIVKEPFINDSRRFVSTEQLICPPGVNITQTISQYYHKPAHANVTGQPALPPNAPYYRPPAIMPVPVNGTPLAVLPPPSYPAVPLPAVLTYEKTQPAAFEPRQPVMAEIPNVATSQVMVLSQKTGYYDTKRKANSSNTPLPAVNWNVMAIVVTLFIYFM